MKYEWNGREFTKERDEPLPEFLNTVEKRRETRRTKFFDLFDRMVSLQADYRMRLIHP